PVLQYPKVIVLMLVKSVGSGVEEAYPEGCPSILIPRGLEQDVQCSLASCASHSAALLRTCDEWRCCNAENRCQKQRCQKNAACHCNYSARCLNKLLCLAANITMLKAIAVNTNTTRGNSGVTCIGMATPSPSPSISSILIS